MSAVEATVPAPTRVLLFDQHPVSLRGLMREVESAPGFEVVGAVGDPAEAVLLAQEVRPDVVVYGASDDAADPVGTVRALHGVARDLAVLVFGGPEPLAGAAIAAGAAGFVAKSAPIPVVLDAIAAVARGDPAPTPTPGTPNRAGTSDGPATPEPFDPPPLTVREWQVLHLLAEGCNAAQIGERLYISRNTARNYVQNVITKLGAHSKLEAVAVARRAGMLGGTRPDPT